MDNVDAAGNEQETLDAELRRAGVDPAQVDRLAALQVALKGESDVSKSIIRRLFNAGSRHPFKTIPLTLVLKG